MVFYKKGPGREYTDLTVLASSKKIFHEPQLSQGECVAAGLEQHSCEIVWPSGRFWLFKQADLTVARSFRAYGIYTQQMWEQSENDQEHRLQPLIQYCQLCQNFLMNMHLIY